MALKKIPKILRLRAKRYGVRVTTGTKHRKPKSIGTLKKQIKQKCVHSCVNRNSRPVHRKRIVVRKAMFPRRSMVGPMAGPMAGSISISPRFGSMKPSCTDMYRYPSAGVQRAPYTSGLSSPYVQRGFNTAFGNGCNSMYRYPSAGVQRAPYTSGLSSPYVQRGFNTAFGMKKRYRRKRAFGENAAMLAPYTQGANSMYNRPWVI